MAPQIEPNQIGQRRADGGGAERHQPIHLASTGQSAGREQPWRGGQRNAHFFNEYRREQNYGPVPNEKLKGFIHGSSLVGAVRSVTCGHRAWGCVSAASSASTPRAPS